MSTCVSVKGAYISVAKALAENYDANYTTSKTTALPRSLDECEFPANIVTRKWVGSGFDGLLPEEQKTTPGGLDVNARKEPSVQAFNPG
jgi:hypothetical protein